MTEQFGVSLRVGYKYVVKKIQKHRPHLNSNSTVVERALDHYLDEIVRLDKVDLKQDLPVGKPFTFKRKKEVIKND